MGKRIIISSILVVLLSISFFAAYTLLNRKEDVVQYTSEEKLNIQDLIESRNSDAYRKYLNDGAKLSFTFPDGYTPLEKLIHNNDFTSAEKILDTGFDLNLIKDSNPVETLTQIIAYNEGRNFQQVDDITIKLINQIKSKIETPDDFGYSFLINTIITDNQPMIVEVLKHVKDIDKVYQGHTALTYATYDSTNLEIIELLVNKGANVNFKGPDGDNALMNAVLNVDSAVPQYLIKNTNVNVNMQNNYGETVLHLAVESENLDVIQLLLSDTNIDKTLKDEDGLTAYDRALAYMIQYGDSYLYDEIEEILK